MKSVILLLSVWLIPVTFLAQEPPPKSSVALDVKTVRSGATSNLTQSGDSEKIGTARTSSYSLLQRQKSGQQGLEIALVNLSSRPKELEVEWYFFARDVKGVAILRHSEGSDGLLMKPGANEKIYVYSAPALSAESRLTHIDRVVTETKVETAVSVDREKAGVKIAGWLVCVKDDGVTVAWKASSGRFEEFVPEDARGKLKTTEEAGGGFVK